MNSRRSFIKTMAGIFTVAPMIFIPKLGDAFRWNLEKSIIVPDDNFTPNILADPFDAFSLAYESLDRDLYRRACVQSVWLKQLEHVEKSRKFSMEGFL